MPKSENVLPALKFGPTSGNSVTLVIAEVLRHNRTPLVMSVRDSDEVTRPVLKTDVDA
jgi:hypothetical protein